MELGGWGEAEDDQNNNERKLIRRPAPTEVDQWNNFPRVTNRAAMGYLHLSFEYHKGILRVRVWQISDLLLPPPQTSMIYSLFVRGYLIPDPDKKTNRKTEDVVVEKSQQDASQAFKTGIQHIFTPSSFKFCNPLLYTGVSGDIVKDRSLQLEVCMTQKHTHRIFLMAMVHMPLRVAIRRPIREKYPLIPCTNITIPNNMRVYSAQDLQLESIKSKGFFTARDARDMLVIRSPGEEDLDDVVSLNGDDFLQSHLSLCLEDSENEDGVQSLQSQIGVSETATSGNSSSTTLDMPSSEDEKEINISDTTVSKGLPQDTSTLDRQNCAGLRKKIVPNEVQSNKDKNISKENIGTCLTGLDMDISRNNLHSSPACTEKMATQPSRKRIIPYEMSNAKLSSSSESDEVSGGQIPPLPLKKEEDNSTQGTRAAYNSKCLEGSEWPVSQGYDQLEVKVDDTSPTSRPETPVWDYYDLDEDLQPEDDPENVNASLEQSLAGLSPSGHDIDKTVSLQPILPMDDLDSLLVDSADGDEIVE